MMDIETPLAKDISITEAKEKYDAACKRLLSEKIILAWIMNGCLKEYQDTDVEEIAAKYIENEPQVSEIPVSPDETVGTIRGINTEDSTVNEGTIYYDIRFVATTPNTKEKISLIINVEAQNQFSPGYHLIKRGIYYGSRMISSEYGKEFVEPNYDDIKKVYSIWVCTNPPKSRANSINRYRITEENLIGTVKEDTANYDLITVMMICLGGPDDMPPSELLKLLNILFSSEIAKEQKKQMLRQKFHIKMTRKIESEVSLMCNLSEGVFEKGLKKGIKQGFEQGIEQGRLESRDEWLSKGVFLSMKNLMNNMSFTAEEAMNALGIADEEKPKYLQMLEAQV